MERVKWREEWRRVEEGRSEGGGEGGKKEKPKRPEELFHHATIV